ncbi:MAG: endonuclease III [Dongiaceae bacterium]
MAEDKAAKPMKARKIEEFFAILQAQNPKPTTELKYTNHFTLLVAVVLSAQTTDISVNKATAELFKIADTPAKMAALGEKKLLVYIKSIGLAPNKAKNVINLSKMILSRFGGQVPQDVGLLQELPGVGRKTANVVMNTLFGATTIAVDTHVFRVANRTGLAPGKNVLQVEENLLKRVPEKYIRNAHHWLILHGRYICKAGRPRCGLCPVSAQCNYPAKTDLT